MLGRSVTKETSGPQLMESRQMFTARWSGTAAEPSQLATQDGRVQGLCALRAGRCRSFPGQFRLPELVLSAPEPRGSGSRAVTLSRADPCFSPTLSPTGTGEPPARPQPSPPSPSCRSPLLGTHSPSRTLIRPHCQSHTPGFSRTRGTGRPESSPRSSQLPPSTDNSYLGSRSHGACPRPLHQLAA